MQEKNYITQERNLFKVIAILNITILKQYKKTFFLSKNKNYFTCTFFYKLCWALNDPLLDFFNYAVTFQGILLNQFLNAFGETSESFKDIRVFEFYI